MSKWFSLHCHSHYSLLDGLSKPHQITARLTECGHAGTALTDHGTISGAASLQKAAKDTCKCGHQKRQHPDQVKRCVARGCTCMGFEKSSLRTVLGCEFYLCQQDASLREPTNRTLSHLCVLARSHQGWKNLVRATSASNRPEFFYHKPRLDLERLAAYGQGQFIAFSGHVGSDLANACFGDNWRAAYSAQTYEQARSFVRDDWKTAVPALAIRYRDLFGKDNFWIEIQRIDKDNMPASEVVANILRWVSKKTGIPAVATADSHYPRREDSEDQRVQLCAALETTLDEAVRKAEAGEDVALGGFFRSRRYHIPTSEEMEALHTPAELAASLAVAERCEDYDILGKPLLPEFPCPEGLTGDQYLRQLCEAGWQRKLAGRTADGVVRGERANSVGSQGCDPVEIPESEYRARLERELGVVCGAGLAGYFLIVQDYCNYARSKGKVGKGRGSGAGCLVSYLTGITDVDPLLYGLLFERFYNAGRNSPGRIALPDIDCDFEKYKREDVIRYIRDKYGDGRVAQMATFTRMQGRGALKDVLRAHGAATFEEMSRITEHIPDESSIADHLQEMLEETGEASIIRWALEYEADALKEWASLREDGTVEGPLGPHFEQAIRLEGTYRSMGRHPSGVIISPVDLADLVPMAHDKSAEKVYVGVDMRDAEAMGLGKFDILGTVVLDKIRGATQIARTGRLSA